MKSHFEKTHYRNTHRMSRRLLNNRKLECISALFLTVAACASPESTANSVEPIVGGEDVDILNLPWQVSLQIRSSEGSKPFHFCGGSILNQFWILTAAHCVDGLQEDELRIVAGSTRISESDTVGQVHDVLRVVSHPSYVTASEGNDIALIRLRKPLNLGAGIGAQAIAMLTSSDESILSDPELLATVSGWGTLRSGGDAPDSLQKVELPIIPNAQAEQMVRMEPTYSEWRMTLDQLAAGYAYVGGKDACQGDSGGPLVVPNKDANGYLLAGVVSWGIGCAEPSFPGFYARVSHFEDWIQETLGAPVVVLQDPMANSVVAGQITVSAQAETETDSISRVEFLLPDGETIVDDSAPFELLWNTTYVPDGFTTIEAQAFDTFGSKSPEDVVEVLVLNGETCSMAVDSTRVPAPIPNNGFTALSTEINVEDIDQVVSAELSLEIRHEDASELSVWLISPDGNYYRISPKDHTDEDGIHLVSYPIEGVRGKVARGTWELHIIDYFPKDFLFPTDPGTLESWSLNFHSACKDADPKPPGGQEPDVEVAGRCVGRTTPGASGWKRYNSMGLVLDVDTSHCGFKTTPQYTTSLGGNGRHWVAEGQNAIYIPTPTGFRIYLLTTATPEEAERIKWHIKWEAIAQEAALVDQCQGRTIPGATRWVKYHDSGFYVDIDTSGCGFDTAPLYFTSLGGFGNHWRALGETAIYKQTANSFRIYVYAPGITPAAANSMGWHINWSAAKNEISSPTFCTGQTTEADWQNYGVTGYYVDVDTSRCDFTDTPEYFTSIQGNNHWRSQGSTAIYLPTETGFRIYLKGADARRTRINWKASPSGL